VTGTHHATEAATMPDQPFGLSTIGQILVPVRDAEAAAAFYRDRLGLRFLFAYPGMAFFDADGVRLYLAQPEEPAFDGRATLYFRVPDIAAAVEALETRGVVFASSPHVVHRDEAHELWMAFTKDPDGNNIGLMSEVPLSPGASGT
jgi:methylmalonyl-CoA/ethylmalonyl-CoA epimerase